MPHLSAVLTSLCSTVCRAGKAAWAIKSKVAVLLASVVRNQGAEAFAQLMPQLLGNADGNTLQVRILDRVFKNADFREGNRCELDFEKLSAN